jgi:hypothetical protein
MAKGSTDGKMEIATESDRTVDVWETTANVSPSIIG